MGQGWICIPLSVSAFDSADVWEVLYKKDYIAHSIQQNVNSES